MSGNELPKVIDKTQADIDAAIDAIQSSNLTSGTKVFAISCVKLAVWFPKALLEQKIRVSNLRKLIFGRGKDKRNKANKGGNSPTLEKAEVEPPNGDVNEMALTQLQHDEETAPTNIGSYQIDAGIILKSPNIVKARYNCLCRAISIRPLEWHPAQNVIYLLKVNYRK